MPLGSRPHLKLSPCPALCLLVQCRGSGVSMAHFWPDSRFLKDVQGTRLAIGLDLLMLAHSVSPPPPPPLARVPLCKKGLIRTIDSFFGCGH